MVYKYQLETLEQLENVRENLEPLTEDRMSLKIGQIRDEWLNSSGTSYYEETRDLYLCLNHESGYTVTTFKSVGEVRSSYGIDEKNATIWFNEDLFLKINEWIDTIYKNKREREQFHERLNAELKALNKTLETQ